VKYQRAKGGYIGSQEYYSLPPEERAKYESVAKSLWKVKGKPKETVIIAGFDIEGLPTIEKEHEKKNDEILSCITATDGLFRSLSAQSKREEVFGFDKKVNSLYGEAKAFTKDVVRTSSQAKGWLANQMVGAEKVMAGYLDKRHRDICHSLKAESSGEPEKRLSPFLDIADKRERKIAERNFKKIHKRYQVLEKSIVKEAKRQRDELLASSYYLEDLEKGLEALDEARARTLRLKHEVASKERFLSQALRAVPREAKEKVASILKAERRKYKEIGKAIGRIPDLSKEREKIKKARVASFSALSATLFLGGSTIATKPYREAGIFCKGRG